MNLTTEQQKICSKCGEEKSVEEFYRDKNRPDGRRLHCKTCYAEYQRSPAGKAVGAAAQKKYRQTEAGKASQATSSKKFYSSNTEAIKSRINEYRQTDVGKAVMSRGRDKWIKNNPEKRRAQNKLNNAVRDGLIVKPSVCSSCNEPATLHGHHEDYSKPLEVDWLCHQCHVDLHKGEIQWA